MLSPYRCKYLYTQVSYSCMFLRNRFKEEKSSEFEFGWTWWMICCIGWSIFFFKDVRYDSCLVYIITLAEIGNSGRATGCRHIFEHADFEVHGDVELKIWRTQLGVWVRSLGERPGQHEKCVLSAHYYFIDPSENQWGTHPEWVYFYPIIAFEKEEEVAPQLSAESWPCTNSQSVVFSCWTKPFHRIPISDKGVLWQWSSEIETRPFHNQGWAPINITLFVLQKMTKHPPLQANPSACFSVTDHNFCLALCSLPPT